MIKKLTIKNFRSIKNLEIELSAFNVFIGPNNAGKSNILAALNLILGESYPTVRSFDKDDFYNYDTTNPIEIKAIFDSPLNCNDSVWGFYLFFDGENCHYIALDEDGNPLRYPSGREVRVSNRMKNEVLLLYIGLNRQATQQIRPSQWTLYGKLLKHIESRIPDTTKEEFKCTVEQSFEEKIFPYIKQVEEILRDHIKSQVGLNLSLRLSLQHPIETIKYLRPYLHENEVLIFDAENMGAGVQSALAIAIARAYAEIVRNPLMIAIEEPELYLHPHGCRHFYRMLKELSNEGIQVVYTTHERSFVNVIDFKHIYLVRKDDSETKVFSGIHKSVSDQDKIKLASKFNEEMNEIFFANKVILVEGPADKIACVLALEKLGLDLDKENISVIDCGSITAIKPVAEILKFFEIPTFVLVDEDPGNETTQKQISRLKEFLGDDKVFIQSPNLERMFGLSKKPNRFEAIKFFTSYLNSKELPQIYVSLKNALEEG